MLKPMGGSENDWIIFNEGYVLKTFVEWGFLWGDLMDDVVNVNEKKMCMYIGQGLDETCHFVSNIRTLG
jgi:hypothetical protein